MIDNSLKEKLIEILPKVKSWINDTLAKHIKEAKPIKDLNLPHLHLYFSNVLLSKTKAVVVKGGRLPKPPLSDWGLSEFADFENRDDDGITYNDTYFIKSKRFHDESIHFHELIHVIQWKYYGFDKFLLAYAEELLSYQYPEGPFESIASDYEKAFKENRIIGNVEDEVLSKLKNLNINILSKVDTL